MYKIGMVQMVTKWIIMITAIRPTHPSPPKIHMIWGIFSPIPTSLGEKMPRLSGILCDDNDDDDRDVVGCGDGGISLPGGCTRVSLILSPRDHSHCDDGDQHSLVSLMLKGRYCNFFIIS